MRSTKDVSDPNDDALDLSECVLPADQTVQGEIVKAQCKDPSHGDRRLREGEQVYAILAEEDDKLEPRSIACMDCSAQSVYEYVSKDTHLYVVSAVLEPEICHGSNNMKLTKITVLDEYVPAETERAQL